MAIKLYFGLPGSGKTTTAVHLCYCFSQQVNKKSPYKNVYTNFDVKCPGITVIDNDCIGQFLLRDCALIIDEALLFANSRDYKNFTKSLLKFMTQHRHFDCDIYFFSQRYNGLDLNIRALTEEVNYIKKPIIIGKWFSYIYKIPYKIVFPDGKSARFGEIIEGYAKPSFFENLFCKKVYRPLYYDCYDTKECYDLPPLPDTYQPTSCADERRTLSKLLSKIGFKLYLIKKKIDKKINPPSATVDNMLSELAHQSTPQIFSEYPDVKF